MFSTVILTLNEEANLPSCLASLRDCGDVVILDSGSTDRTCEIASAAGARVVQRPFTNFADQRNYAHTSIPDLNTWILHLDADERMTPELARECEALASSDPADLDGCFIAPKMIYHGRWIPRCTDFPAYQARFVHRDRFRFVQVGHGQREAPRLQLRTMSANYLHYLSAGDDTKIVAKHRRYAVQEAADYLSRSPRAEPLLPRLITGEPLVRRRALKELAQRLPAKGPLRFIYQYIWRRGFLDGAAGLSYCVLLARYEHWIGQEIRRLRRSAP